MFFKGRLNGNSCWMPVKDKARPYIRIAFVTKVTIVAIATQGAPDTFCWVKSYFLHWRSYASAGVIIEAGDKAKTPFI